MLRRLDMLTRTKIALATVLMVVSALTAFAGDAKPRHHHRAPTAVAAGRYAVRAAPYTSFEQRWFDGRSQYCCPP